MIYCRFSSDNWKSDVYAHKSRNEFYVHVATRRLTSEIPSVPSIVSVSSKAWAEACRVQLEAVRKSNSEKIGGEFDGRMFIYHTLKELLDGLLEIQGQGYYIPHWTFDNIRTEMSDEKS